MINDGKLKQIHVSRISISGGDAGQAVVINDSGTACTFGNVAAEGGGGGGGAGGGYTGLHDYGAAPFVSGSDVGGGPFTGDLTQNFCVLNVTGNISGFTFSNSSTGNTSIIKIINPSPNSGWHVRWDTGISWLGGSPGAFESGKEGMLTVVSYDTGIDGNITGQIMAGYAAED